MERGKINELNEGAAGASFFYDQWKHALVEPEPAPAEREPEQLREVAHASLHKYKQTLLEYQKLQQAQLHWKEKSSQAKSPRDLAIASQALRHFEAQLDSLERELRGGRSKTKTALQDYQAAS